MSLAYLRLYLSRLIESAHQVCLALLHRRRFFLLMLLHHESFELLPRFCSGSLRRKLLIIFPPEIYLYIATRNSFDQMDKFLEAVRKLHKPPNHYSNHAYVNTGLGISWQPFIIFG